jgi:hypothetical protein
MIELRPPDRDGQPFGTHVLIDPQRGHVITRVRFHVDGVVTREHRAEPVLLDNAEGEDVWVPGSVEVETWRLGADGERTLRSHKIMRFEEMRVNLRLPDDAFSLPVALQWEDGHGVRVHDADRPREMAAYRDGELSDPVPIYIP